MSIALQVCIVVIAVGVLAIVATHAYFIGNGRGFQEGMQRMRDISFSNLQQLRDELEKERRKKAEK